MKSRGGQLTWRGILRLKEGREFLISAEVPTRYPLQPPILRVLTPTLTDGRPHRHRWFPLRVSEKLDSGIRHGDPGDRERRGLGLTISALGAGWSVAHMSARLVLAKRAHAGIIDDCLEHPDTETGGLLPVRVFGEDFVAPFCIPAGPRAHRSPTRFSPDTDWQQILLDFVFANFGLNYGGDYGILGSSTGQARTTKTARRHRHRCGVGHGTSGLPDRGDRQRESTPAYLMRRVAPDFEEIPIKVLDDSDPIMTSILSGAEPQEVELCVR